MINHMKQFQLIFTLWPKHKIVPHEGPLYIGTREKFPADGFNMFSSHIQYQNGIQGQDVTDRCNLSPNLFIKPFFMYDQHNLLICLLKSSNSSLDAEHMFLCPLFEILFNAASVGVLFAEAAPYGTKERCEYQ